MEWMDKVKEERTLECGCVEFLINKELQGIENCIDHPGSVDWRGSDKMQLRKQLHKLEKQQIELEKQLIPLYLKRVEQWEKERAKLERLIDFKLKEASDDPDEEAKLACTKESVRKLSVSLMNLRMELKDLE
jgi:hypothetical protein